MWFVFAVVVRSVYAREREKKENIRDTTQVHTHTNGGAEGNNRMAWQCVALATEMAVRDPDPKRERDEKLKYTICCCVMFTRGCELIQVNRKTFFFHSH